MEQLNIIKTQMIHIILKHIMMKKEERKKDKLYVVINAYEI